jgi:hypothetical protein
MHYKIKRAIAATLLIGGIALVVQMVGVGAASANAPHRPAGLIDVNIGDVTVCGNAVAVAGFAKADCSNSRRSYGHTMPRSDARRAMNEHRSRHGHHGHHGRHGHHGVIDVNVGDVTVCGNAIAVLGVAKGSCGNSRHDKHGKRGSQGGYGTHGKHGSHGDHGSRGEHHRSRGGLVDVNVGDVTVCGNAIAVLGVAKGSCSGSHHKSGHPSGGGLLNLNVGDVSVSGNALAVLGVAKGGGSGSHRGDCHDKSGDSTGDAG